ncbi:MAG: hypothetical protein DRJ65_00135 [Acidobacteria bacterium]|nr:MAG: hypothetical protein DRJ65_00135 [Acidobacteriota bacterium]
MCKERRKAIGLVDMSGETAVQINVKTVRLYLGVMISVFVLISMFWGGGAVAARWMSSEAETNFHHRIDDSLAPPSGDIYRAIKSGVTEHERDQMEQFQAIEIELAVQRTMIEEIHRAVIR